jgi:glutaredoxin
MGYQVFGRPSCNYCQQTKTLLEKYNLAYDFYDLRDPVVAAMYVEKYRPFVPTTHTTVPVIFYNKIFIGGFTDLKNKLT